MTSETTSRHFEWDYASRMRVYRTQVDGSEPTVYAHYLYGAGGERVKKLVRRQGGEFSATIYIDGLFEHDRLVGATLQENDTLHIMDGKSRIATERVGPAFHDDATPAVKYQLGDHLGSSHVVLDDSGALVNREEYRPYGQTSFGSFGRKRYRFNGKERDEESGLYYYGARYYAPWLGRWTAADPMGTVDGTNLYAYVRGSPVNLVDPDGTQNEDPWLAQYKERFEAGEQSVAPEAANGGGGAGGAGSVDNLDPHGNQGGTGPGKSLTGGGSGSGPTPSEKFDTPEERRKAAEASTASTTLVAIALGLAALPALLSGGSALAADAAPHVAKAAPYVERGLRALGYLQIATSSTHEEAAGGILLALTPVGGPRVPVGRDVTLYRAVGDAEIADIEAMGRYRVPAGGTEGKYFFQTPEQASNFARMMGDQPYTTTSVRVSPAQLGRGQTDQPSTGGPGLLLPDPRCAARPRHDLAPLGTTAMSRKIMTVRVQLLPTAEGGRSGPLLSGYRSLIRFEGTDLDFGFELELDATVGPAGIAPGTSGTGRASFWAVEDLPSLFAGQGFEVREGVRVVGHGILIDPA